MTYAAETAAIKMAVKRTLKAGNPEAGFSSLKKWSEAHPLYDSAAVLKCFRKWLKRRFYNAD